MKNVSIYTDGSCLNNGHKGAYGGWAAILIYTDKFGKDHRVEYTGSKADTTNNRMELCAAINGISKLKMPCVVTIFTDSTYVCRSAGNMKKLADNGWHTISNKYCMVKNKDLLEQLWQVITDGKHELKFQHINGHAGIVENERADALAQSAARALKIMEELNAEE